ncbi:MAG: methyl-accepting chemotaxis protein [Proteobacteria bacterium]|nr:methyl-accepting chemotaxis protein [Pseudomonadota bacterium]MBU1738226.1 methyl-accepting chemotaxis protein [Pseudomonadota bacterium]
MKHKRKKLNLQVKKKFQIWLLKRILATVVVSSVVAALILYFYAQQEVGASFYEAHIKIRKVSDLLIPVILAGSFVSLISGTLLALFLPQKVAGPVFRMEQDLKEIQEGNFNKVIRLRDGDPLQGLAETINQTFAVVREKLKSGGA